MHVFRTDHLILDNQFVFLLILEVISPALSIPSFQHSDFSPVYVMTKLA